MEARAVVTVEIILRRAIDAALARARTQRRECKSRKERDAHKSASLSRAKLSGRQGTPAASRVSLDCQADVMNKKDPARPTDGLTRRVRAHAPNGTSSGQINFFDAFWTPPPRKKKTNKQHLSDHHLRDIKAVWDSHSVIPDPLVPWQ